MLLSSYAFFAFFACVVVVHFLVPQRFRWIVLLAASAYFYYSFAPKFLLVIGGVILLTYGGALLVERSHGGRRKLYFVSSVVLTCLILLAFKYLPFMNANLSHLARVLDLHYPTFVINIALPIGLSFYIFQSLSYLIEVYWGRQKAERHLGYYAVYIMFFLRLIAGPIERPGSFLPQLRARKDFDWERILGGLKLMLWGLFKKLVIADRLGAIVANVYGHPHSYTGLSLVLATVFFSIQIFCDFSGYSDIAIGGAQIMGYRLTTNFDRPYHSKSIAEFWRRWHISFSSWLRDYLYIPLGGNRVPKWRWAVNTMIVFLVCGIWHGAGWTFVIWGALQGIYLIFGRVTKRPRAAVVKFVRLDRLPRLYSLWAILVTFALASFGWLFFRAGNLETSKYIVRHLVSGWHFNAGYLSSTLHSMGIVHYDWYVIPIAILFLEYVHHLHPTVEDERRLFDGRHVVVRWASLYGLIVMIILLGVFAKSSFIYAQF